MKRNIPIIFFVIVIFAFPVFGAADETVRVIWSDNQEVILELVVPGFQVKNVNQGATSYQQVTIPDFGLTTDIGHPQVPLRGVVVGVAEGAQPVLEIQTADFETFPNYQIAPVPLPEMDEEGGMVVDQHFTFVQDDAIYSKDAFYPPNIVHLGFRGKMRDQEVVQVVFNPIQFNPTREEIRFYNRILVRIGFNGASGRKNRDGSMLNKPHVFEKPGSETGVKPSPYERMLEGLLLNYQEVRGR